MPRSIHRDQARGSGWPGTRHRCQGQPAVVQPDPSQAPPSGCAEGGARRSTWALVPQEAPHQ